MNKKIIFCIVVIFVSFLIVFGCYGDWPHVDDPDENGCTDELVFKPNVDTLGVWWWSHTPIDGPYLDFAAKNGANEIYFSTNTFGTAVSDFITRAHAKGIKVYWLQGDVSWIRNDAVIRQRILLYLQYQENSAVNSRFAGVHFNIEPHQDSEWRNDPLSRPGILDMYLSLVERLSTLLPDVHIDHVIPFWFRDPIMYKGESVPLYQAMIRESDRVIIMSYRDTAERIINLGSGMGPGNVQDQIAFAKSLDKPIFLGAESSNPPEGTTEISFRLKGKRFMYEELNKLKGLANYDKLGIAIHHMRTWYNLQDDIIE